MRNLTTYRIFPLGDSALLLDFGNVITEDRNREVLAIAKMFDQKPLPGVIEIVPAYSSIAIYYDVFKLNAVVKQPQTVYDWMSCQVRERLPSSFEIPEEDLKIVSIPVCYSTRFGPDLEFLAESNHLSIEEIISLHTGKIYRVYMLGFLPGFTYMAEVEERLTIPRKKIPSARVEAGSIGIAGKQTGIYPLTSPGGWQIIGRTPLKLFDPYSLELTLLKEGDSVQFISITENEFANY